MSQDTVVPSFGQPGLWHVCHIVKYLCQVAEEATNDNGVEASIILSLKIGKLTYNQSVILVASIWSSWRLAGWRVEDSVAW